MLNCVVDDFPREGMVAGPRRGSVVRPLPPAPLARTYEHRVLAVGDAAGLVKPTTGGGIYYSLLSAVWAAEAIVRAFEGLTSPLPPKPLMRKPGASASGAS